MQQFDQAPVPDDIQAQVGTLSNLTTTEKSNLVGAVNEVKSTLSDLFPFAKGTASDCNALTSEGAWRTNANTLNMPNNKTGFCEVSLRASESQIYQKYSTVDGYVYWRYTTNGSFANISWKEELNDQIPLYKGKGTYSRADYWGATGFVTGSSKNLYIQIHLLVAPDVTSISITEAKIALRIPTGGYLVSSGYDITSLITAQYVKNTEGLILIEAEKSDGWGIANNAPVIGVVTVAFTLS